MMEAVSAEDCAPRVRDLCLQLLANVTRVQVRRRTKSRSSVTQRSAETIRAFCFFLFFFQDEAGGQTLQQDFYLPFHAFPKSPGVAAL